jgi:hypothetical protein
MNAKEAYMAGFSKVAKAHGVDVSSIFRSEKKAEDGILDSLARTYRGLDPYTRRALIGGLATGALSTALSGGGVGNRLLNGTLGGLAGGLGLYGLDRSGATDLIVDYIRNNVGRLRPVKKESTSGLEGI